MGEVLPLLYLHGLVLWRLRPRHWSSFSDRWPGLSSATVPWLAKQWQDDHAAFQQHDLADRDFV
ncbi:MULTISPECIES: hypothetical protein [unclassified Streptomyces]|uniref:hypothetical protein n=1 Tax=unclassified Streptomyces TaxID=2593676 RepID=UPI0015872F9A|nr:MULTISPECIES: hypothetical protein [unclassified Streptomyces]